MRYLDCWLYTYYTMQNARLKNYLHFHFIVFIFGFTAILGELITLEALPLVWYRMWLATGFVFVYIKWKKLSLKVSPKLFLVLTFAGVIIALHWCTFFGAIKASNVSITLAVLSTGAFFTAFLEPIFYRRKLIWYELLFGLVVIFGLYLIFSVEGDYVMGILLALLSAFFASIFTLINGKVIEKQYPSVISFYELLTGVLGVTLYFLFQTIFGDTTSGFSAAFFTVKASDWLYLLVLASICTAYAFIASVKVMRYLSPYTIMLTNNLEPVYGIFLAFLIFGNNEKMEGKFYIGAALILTTVVLNGAFKMLQKRKIAST